MHITPETYIIYMFHRSPAPWLHISGWLLFEKVNGQPMTHRQQACIPITFNFDILTFIPRTMMDTLDSTSVILPPDECKDTSLILILTQPLRDVSRANFQARVWTTDSNIIILSRISNWSGM